MENSSHITELESRITKLEQRNARVDLDKKWEVSFARRVLLMLFTYVAVSQYFVAIDISQPYLNAVVPTLAFLLSTLALPYFKQLWIRYIR